MKIINHRLIATGRRDSSIIIWDYQNNQIYKNLTGHTNYVRCLEVLNDVFLLSGSADSTIKIWNIESGLLYNTISPPTTRQLTSLQYLSNFQFASGAEGGELNIYDFASGTLKQSFLLGYDWVMCLNKLQNGYLVIGNNGGTVVVWNPSNPTGLPVKVLYSPGSVRSIDVFNNGNFVSVDLSGYIIIWNGNTYEEISRFNHQQALISVSVLNFNSIAVLTEYEAIQIYDIQYWYPTYSFKCNNASSRVDLSRLGFINNKYLICGSSDGMIKSWRF